MPAHASLQKRTDNNKIHATSQNAHTIHSVRVRQPLIIQIQLNTKGRIGSAPVPGRQSIDSRSTQYSTLRCTALHCTALHCTALHYLLHPAYLKLPEIALLLFSVTSVLEKHISVALSMMTSVMADRHWSDSAHWLFVLSWIVLFLMQRWLSTTPSHMFITNASNHSSIHHSTLCA